MFWFDSGTEFGPLLTFFGDSGRLKDYEDSYAGKGQGKNVKLKSPRVHRGKRNRGETLLSWKTESIFILYINNLAFRRMLS